MIIITSLKKTIPIYILILNITYALQYSMIEGEKWFIKHQS